LGSKQIDPPKWGTVLKLHILQSSLSALKLDKFLSVVHVKVIAHALKFTRKGMYPIILATGLSNILELP